MYNFKIGIGPYLFVACWCLFIFGIMAMIFAGTGETGRIIHLGKKFKLTP